MSLLLRLAFAELLAATGFMQADFLPFHFARIARDETGLFLRGFEFRVEVDQGPGDAMAHGTGLA